MTPYPFANMELFFLRRDVDATGSSGTGTVAEGVIFADGKVAMHWLSEVTSVAIYESIDDVIAIHGHGGSTKVITAAAPFGRVAGSAR